MAVLKCIVPLICVATIAISKANDATMDEDLFSSEDLPLVLSATRLRQTQSETPASVTIINREKIKRSGARSIEEVLRLVPGVVVSYSRGNTAEVSIHGLNGEFSRRIQVLVDGRSIFKPGLARVLWGSLPFNLEDIERIEVIRGPNTTSYGANAFLGAVNIITRKPEDIEGNKASISKGNNGVLDAYLRLTDTNDKLSYELTYGHSEDDGFDGIFSGQQRFDNSETNYLAADFSYNPNLSNQVRVQLGASEAKQQIDLLDEFETTPFHISKTNDKFIQLTWNNNQSARSDIQVNAYYNHNTIEENWETCVPAFFLTDELGQLFDLDSAYTALFVESLILGTPTPQAPSQEVADAAQQSLIRAAALGNQINCGQANQNFDESKWELEIQNTFRINKYLRLVAGFAFRHDEIEGESFFDNKLDNDIQRLFGNVEWKLTDNWILNLGAMYEDSNLINSEISPRLGMNYLTGPDSGFRFIIAQGTRAPNFYENLSHRHYRVRELEFPVNGTDNFATFYQTPQSPGDLSSEKNLSREIGWFYRPTSNLNLDVKIFYDNLENVIDGLSGLDDFSPANDLDFVNSGLDFQLDYSFNQSNHLWFAYSYLDISPKRGRNLRSSGEGASYSILYTHEFSDKSQINSAYYLNDINGRNNFERFDVSYSHKIPLNKNELSIAFVVQHYLNEEAFYSKKNVIGSSSQAFIKASINF